MTIRMPGAVKGVLTAAVLATASLAATPSLAEIKGLEIIAPASPGGGWDQHARTLQQVFQDQKLASNIQVVNIPGAGGTVGLAQFVTARKRTPALLVGGQIMLGAIVTNKSAVTLDQVSPLARLTGEYQPIVVAADSPLKTLDDLVRKFKADPGSVSWGGFAVGSPDHILYGLLVKAIGGDVSKMNYIAAGAGGEMMASVLGGHITVATGGYNEFAPQLQSGKLRALAISAPQRVPGVDIPTFREQGVDVELVNWRAVMAPGNLKASEMQVLDDAVGAMVRTDDWKRIAAERGWIDLYLPPEKFAAFVKDERTRIEGVLTDLGLVKP